jgi:hypothetical protein
VTTDLQLSALLDSCPIHPGQRWRHYKGAEVSVERVVIDEATLTPAVVYHHYPATRTIVPFVRLVSVFLESVQGEDGLWVPRFTRVEEP